MGYDPVKARREQLLAAINKMGEEYYALIVSDKHVSDEVLRGRRSKIKTHIIAYNQLVPKEEQIYTSGKGIV